MAYDNVLIPSGATVSVGDSVGALVDVGVLKGDASLEITYDLVKVKGSKAETLVNYAKNAAVAATFELYQWDFDVIQDLLDGFATVTDTAGAEQADHDQDWAANTTEAGVFYPFDLQQATGVVPTSISVEGDPDGTPDGYVLNTDYRVISVNGIWGLLFVSGGDYTATELIRATYTATPSAAQTLKMGDATAELTAKIVKMEYEDSAGTTVEAYLWSAVNEAGLKLTFPDSSQEEPASLPVVLQGGLDTSRTAGDQLIQIIYTPAA